MAGIDEVGVGALAGPLIVAAAIVAPDTIIDGVADSKLLSPTRRQALSAAIREAAIAVGIGKVEVEEVDRINVYWAAMEARRRALEELAAAPAHVAKVTRDGLMTDYARPYPGYGFERHKGYATAAHLAALSRLGPLSLHRRSCAPVRKAGGLEQ